MGRGEAARPSSARGALHRTRPPSTEVWRSSAARPHSRDALLVADKRANLSPGMYLVNSSWLMKSAPNGVLRLFMRAGIIPEKKPYILIANLSRPQNFDDISSTETSCCEDTAAQGAYLA